jgi:hypothetical protein
MQIIQDGVWGGYQMAPLGGTIPVLWKIFLLRNLLLYNPNQPTFVVRLVLP